MSNPNPLAEIERRLAEPFETYEVRFKPGAVKDDRALAMAYIDARVVQDRLDEVVGAIGWQDSYEVLPDGTVICTLKVKIGGEWICKQDVGGPSEQKDPGDKRKAAFSDALKRAAVKFGIGRYLYRIPQTWCPYSPQSRKFTQVPVLPAWALPGKKPVTAQDVMTRLVARDAELVKAGKCTKGALVQAVMQAVTDAKHSPDLKTWSDECVRLVLVMTPAIIAEIESQAGQDEVPPQGELIGQKERLELPRLMKSAARTWSQCIGWLQSQGQGEGLTPQTPVNDLTMQQYLVLSTGLNQIIKAQLQQKAG